MGRLLELSSLCFGLLNLFWFQYKEHKVCLTKIPMHGIFKLLSVIYSNKKVTSDFHGTVSFDPNKMSQQKIYQNVYQTSDTQKLVII